MLRRKGNFKTKLHKINVIKFFMCPIFSSLLLTECIILNVQTEKMRWSEKKKAIQASDLLPQKSTFIITNEDKYTQLS